MAPGRVRVREPNRVKGGDVKFGQVRLAYLPIVILHCRINLPVGQLYTYVAEE